MKVLFLINSLSSRSGSERVACNLANLFYRNLNYEVSIANRDTDFNEIAYELDINVKTYKLDGNILIFYSKIKKLCENLNPDFIIIHNMGRLSILCSFLSRNYKVISLEHGAFNGRPLFVKLLSKLVYNRFSKIVALTKSDSFNYKSFNKNVIVIPNISPFDISLPTLSSKKIISIGRLDDNKNYIHLIKAWEKIQGLKNDWQLEIYGDGVLKDELNKYINDNRIQNVELKGEVKDVSKVYSDSSLFILTSKFEGFPMVLVEAQSYGIPIISYDCPYGPNEIVTDGFNGTLVDNQNINELAFAIEKLINSPDTLNQYSSNSLVNAHNFQPSRVLELWVACMMDEGR